MALSRNLNKTVVNISDYDKKIVTKILGTNDWINEIYNESSQINLFDEEIYEKKAVSEVKQYILKRFQDAFPAVSPEAVLLRNEKNSPMFLLCFMCSNPAEKARTASLRVANHILTHTDMERV